ncbi:Branched-chain amino acid ABC transporter, amino acid-binding protein (TC 3.A.1.4.1) [Olavius algarvensis Delta 1 endosymbiont]|nr:Branched-chain amino acid ABC transporter, amino acid-binding protein (TC 3.A.1.4.1) [Olavius algarvensis Delta 1 endosymbiont]
MKTKHFIVIALVVGFIAGITISATAADTLGIGLCAPMSGGAASWGKKSEVGVKFAIERINARGGVVPKGQATARMLELIEVADDKNDPREGASIAQRFIDNEKILIMVGPLTSTVALAQAPILNKHGLTQFAIGATAPAYTKAGPYSFRLVPTDAFQGRYMAKWANDQGKWKTYAIIYVNDDYGRGLAEVFQAGLKEIGVDEKNVVASEAFLPNDTDFSVQLTKIRGLKPDALFIAGHYKEGALIARQARELALKAQILGTDGIGHPEYIKVAGKSAEGTIYSGYFSLEDKRPYIQEWAADFKAKLGYDPGLVEAIANDCVEIAAKAIEIGGDSRKDVAIGMSTIGLYNPSVAGALGDNQFDGNGDTMRDMLMYVVKDGAAVFYE